MRKLNIMIERFIRRIMSRSARGKRMEHMWCVLDLATARKDEGCLTAWELGERAGISNFRCYVYLFELERGGWVESWDKGGVRYYRTNGYAGDLVAHWENN